MADSYKNEPILEMYMFETSQLIEQLEKLILDSEEIGQYTHTSINDIFRIMHIIKGSSAMMMFDNISNLAHVMEDVFYFLREEKPQQIDYPILSDLILESIDFMKKQIKKIKSGEPQAREINPLIKQIRTFLDDLKQWDKSPQTVDCQKFEALIYFESGCQMENIRAYSIIRKLEEITKDICYDPENILDDN